MLTFFFFLIRGQGGVLEIIPAVTRQKAGINPGKVTGQRVSRQTSVHASDHGRKPETGAPDTERSLLTLP